MIPTKPTSNNVLSLLRAVVSAEDLYRGVRFQCWVLEVGTERRHVCCLVQGLPRNCGTLQQAQVGGEGAHYESTLVTAMRKAAVHRLPTVSRDFTIQDVASLLDADIAGMVVNMDASDFVVFPLQRHIRPLQTMLVTTESNPVLLQNPFQKSQHFFLGGGGS